MTVCFKLKRWKNGDTNRVYPKTGKIVAMSDPTDRSRAYPNRPLPAVGAVVFKEDRVLLVRRANPPSKGVWAIPGGSIRTGETLQCAAEREIHEETGVTIRARDPVFVFDAIERDDRGAVKYHYVIVDLLADYVSGEPRAGDDATDARWFTPDELARLPVSPITRKLLLEKFRFGE